MWRGSTVIRKRRGRARRARVSESLSGRNRGGESGLKRLGRLVQGLEARAGGGSRRGDVFFEVGGAGAEARVSVAAAAEEEDDQGEQREEDGGAAEGAADDGAELVGGTRGNGEGAGGGRRGALGVGGGVCGGGGGRLARC